MTLPDLNLAGVISAHAASRPDAPAVIEPDRTLSYRELDGAIWRAAAWLRDWGARTGDVVGVALPGTAVHLVAALALARLGAVQLQLPARESQQYREALARRFDVKSVLDGSAVADVKWLEDGPAPADPGLRCEGGDLPWKIVLTSGTTGGPRAVLQTHAMHLAWRRTAQAAIPLRPEDRYLAVVGLDFVAGFVRCMSLLDPGGAVLLGFPLRDTVEVLEFFEHQAISHAYLTPTHLQNLLRVPGDHRARLRALRVLRVGSMVVGERMRREVRDRLTPNLLVSYGTNDGGTPLTVADAGTLDRHPGSLGFPCPGVEIGIVDDEERPLGAGITGNVRVRAAGMPSAYIGDPEASARAYRGGWFYPGDLGYLSGSGALYFRGRSDERMNFDGIKIYPVEIESVLLEHPSVAEAAAFGVPSEEHQDVPAVAVVLREAIDGKVLRAWAQQRLGVRNPQRWLELDALPRNARGKVLRRELAALAASPRKQP